MKWSKTFIPTLKEAPKEAEVPSHKLMLRAGLIQNLSSGLYTYLPIGKKVIDKVMNTVRRILSEYDAIELTMPVLQPKAIWERSGRYEIMADLMMKIKDREKKEFVLGPTHEEIITDLVSKRINSYRQLPLNFYQIQNKFRDEIRPRFGVIRSKEFIMKDGYSFDLTDADAFKTYDKMYEAYSRIFKYCGIESVPVLADTGAMGDGGRSHEFMALSAIGEDTIVRCQKCGYAANLELAVRKSKPVEPSRDPLKALELVDTPEVRTVEEVSVFFKIDSRRLIKTLIYKADDCFVAVLIRGDVEVNEIKLKRFLKASQLNLAEAKDIENLTHAPVGFAGPVGLSGARIVADFSVEGIQDAVTGANQAGKHYQHVYPGRDFPQPETADLGICREEDVCFHCGGEFSFARGIEVGQVFYLGKKYSQKLDAKVIDPEGKESTLVMGCYGIGVSRTVAAIIECNHDSSGIVWPVTVAPYEVVVIAVDFDDEKVRNESLRIYESLKSKGVDVLLDDRPERPGFKFKDAELIGFPVRVTVGKNAIEKNSAEVTIRKTKVTELIGLAQVDQYVCEKIQEMKKIYG